MDNRLLNRTLVGDANDRVTRQNRLMSEAVQPVDIGSFSPFSIGRKLLEGIYSNPQGAAELGLSVAPGSGEAMSARDAWNASGRGYNALLEGNYGQAAGEYGNMATAALGAVPGLGMVARGTKRGAAWMDKNLPGAVNKLLDAVLPADPKNTLNVFAGPTARNADHAALTTAQNLQASGATRDEIWNRTGWFQGVDGQWRFEIDDSSARLAGGDNGRFTRLDHPELDAAYADLPEMSGAYGPGIGLSGSRFEGRLHAQGPDAGAAKEAALHEIQHDLQAREGFTPGSSLEYLGLIGEGRQPDVQAMIDYHRLRQSRVAKDSQEYLQAQAKINELENEGAWDVYRRTAGEVEARNVQSRMTMSAADRRAKAPWLTQDVPDEQQIIRGRE